MKKTFVALAGAASLASVWLLLGTTAHADDHTTTLAYETAPVSGDSFNQATASCPNGMVVTGGGVDIGGTDPGNAGVDLTERYSGPSLGGTSWTLGMDNHSSSEKSFTVVAICVAGTTSG